MRARCSRRAKARRPAPRAAAAQPPPAAEAAGTAALPLAWSPRPGGRGPPAGEEGTRRARRQVVEAGQAEEAGDASQAHRVLMIRIVGGGLAGSEAAWQAASRGVPVVLHEMRPVRPTAVHKTDRLAELVCSNSFRGDKLDNAVGLLKEEMRRLGSLVMRAADASRVPAGAALAVDRDLFSSRVTEAIGSHPLISIRRGEIAKIPSSLDGPVILATGP